jgi:hypothetical protein
MPTFWASRYHFISGNFKYGNDDNEDDQAEFMHYRIIITDLMIFSLSEFYL